MGFWFSLETARFNFTVLAWSNLPVCLDNLNFKTKWFFQRNQNFLFGKPIIKLLFAGQIQWGAIFNLSTLGPLYKLPITIMIFNIFLNKLIENVFNNQQFIKIIISLEKGIINLKLWRWPLRSSWWIWRWYVWYLEIYDDGLICI